jgi:hypothetical protein
VPGCEQMLRQDDSAVPSMCLPEHVTNSCGFFVLDPTPVTFYSQQRVFSVQLFELHRLIKVRWSLLSSLF